MRNFSLLFLFFITGITAAQSGNPHLDSLFNLYAGMHGYHAELSAASIESDSSLTGHIKCGFPLSLEIRLNYDALSPEQKKLFAKIVVIEEKQTSLISPDSLFRIHYDTTGLNVPEYVSGKSARENAMFAAEAFDSAYAFEVDYLGFIPPPTIGKYYDVYIENTGATYGWTDTEGRISGNKYYTYITIHNNYRSFFTKGIEALNVTAAHEFHHAIQIGSYSIPVYSEDLFFLEMTSTSMEEFVFDDVNDYYLYLRSGKYSYFSAPDNNFMYAANSAEYGDYGYGLVIWNLYLQQKYGQTGYEIIKRQWEAFAEGKRAMDAIDAGLRINGSTFQKEFAEFSVWNYFTGHRAINGKFYDEARAYPLISPSHVTSTIPLKLNLNLFPLSANYFYLDTREDGLENDTLAVIITNGDIERGLGNNASIGASYSLNNYDYNGTVLSVNNSFNASNTPYWTISYIYNNMTYIPEILEERNLESPFPNPYRYSYRSEGTEISIPVKNKKLDKANLNVYTVSGDLVYKDVRRITSFGGMFIIKWNGLNNDNEKLPDGIYFYAAECDGDIYKGKIAIFNE